MALVVDREAYAEQLLRQYKQDLEDMQALKILEKDMREKLDWFKNLPVIEDVILGGVLQPPRLGDEGGRTSQPSSSTERLAVDIERILASARRELTRNLSQQKTAQQRIDRMDRALKKLPAFERYAIEQFYLHDKSWPEIERMFEKEFSFTVSIRGLMRYRDAAIGKIAAKY